MDDFGMEQTIGIDDLGAVLAEAATAEDRRSRRFRAELSAGTSVHQEVVIEAGPPQPGGDTLVIPLRWKPTGHERLLPTFGGELEAAPARSGTRLRLSGSYAVPLRWVGRFGDDAIGHRAACRSLGRYLEDVARRLDAEVHHRLASASSHASPHAARPPEPGSENYIG